MTDAFGEALTNPENFYHKDPNYPFVGYFFVPKGGIHVGVRAYEKKLLKGLQKHHYKHPNQMKLQSALKRSVRITQESDNIKTLSYQMWEKNPRQLLKIWDEYVQNLCTLTLFLKRNAITRLSLLKPARTRVKERD